MTIAKITKRVEELGHTWEQFKEVNDRRLKEIETKGNADSVTVDHLNRINEALDGYKSRLSGLETAASRPVYSMKSARIPMNEAQVEHKEAFCNYLRKGQEDDLVYLEKKALSVGSNADGGYLVTPHISERIIESVFETSPMRQLASVETISSDVFEIIEDYDEAGAGWTASETAAVVDTTSPQIGKKIIPAHELVAQPQATQKLIDDSSIDIESWLADKLTDVFTRLENAAFINGTGVGQPRGILSYANGTNWGEIEQVDSGANGVVTADSLINLYYSLPEEYLTRSTFMMNRATAQQVRLLKEGSTGQYLWNPGLAAGAPDTLLGVPVRQAADMPTPTTGSLSIALADFRRAYQIVDRTDVRILRDPYTEKPFVKFYTTKRVGGDVADYRAIKLLALRA